METRDEMAELWLQALPRNPADLPLLHAEVEKRTFEFAIDFAEYRLRLNPRDAKAHVRYAQSLLAKGQREKAGSHLEAAVKADPNYDEPHYFLGLIARLNNQPNEALRHFSEAVRLN